LERASEFGEREPWEGEGRESFGETKRPRREKLWEKETPLMLFLFWRLILTSLLGNVGWICKGRTRGKGVSNVFQVPAFGRKMYK
jgi:hypothetical protein